MYNVLCNGIDNCLYAKVTHCGLPAEPIKLIYSAGHPFCNNIDSVLNY